MGGGPDILTVMLNFLIPAALAAPPDLSGNWEIVLTVVTSAKIPVFGDTEISTKTTLIANIDGLVQQHSTCRVEPTSPLRVVTTTIPDDFVRLIPVKTYPITLTEDGGYRVDFGPQYIAYDPNLSGGLPPSEADHPAVTDWEGDGQPGATIHLDAPVFGRSEVYITQLAHTRLAGRITGPDAISGGVEVLAMQQRSIGAKPSMFAANPEVTAVPEASGFTMRRLPAGATCADL